VRGVTGLGVAAREALTFARAAHGPGHKRIRLAGEPSG
jgi:hypothetical protein